MGIGDVRYAKSGDLSIAYRRLSEAGVDLLLVPGFVAHVMANDEAPPVAHFINPFTRFARVVVFDKRGTGMSDRDLGTGAFEDRMDDLRAVMDAAGMMRANLLGWSEGVPLSLLFAATYPERVRRLVLYAGYARMASAPDYPLGLPPERGDDFAKSVEARWGTGDVLRQFSGDWPTGRAGEEAVEVAARSERLMCTPGGARELMRSNLASDVRAILPHVKQPTLVIHNVGDPVVPVQFGRYIADQLPNATLLELPGAFHMSWTAEVYRPLHDAVEHFLTGRSPDAGDDGTNSERVLATVLFTDIVDSTRCAAEMGDAAWRTLLGEHDRRTRGAVERHRGRVVKTTGDGAMAMFDGPARAIRAAAAIRDAVGEVGLVVRAGLHTGEVEVVGDDVAGIAVHLGARVSGLAGPGEVLVSRTVADLVAGSGIEFVDRGEHELKGVPGTWRILSATV